MELTTYCPICDGSGEKPMGRKAHDAYNLIKSHPDSTASQLAEMAGVSTATMIQRCYALVDNEYVIRSKEGNPHTYKVAE